MNKGIYRIAAGVGAAVILVSSATAQAATVTADGTPAPVASDSIAGWPAAPAVTSETAVLIDADTGAVLYDKGMDEYRYPASTTKIMTLLVAIENSSPKDIVTFTDNYQQKSFTHRIVEIDEQTQSFVTKGDANKENDLGKISAEYAQGKVEVSIPYLGYFVKFLRYTAVKVAIAIIYVAWAAIEIELFMAERKKAND